VLKWKTVSKKESEIGAATVRGKRKRKCYEKRVRGRKGTALGHGSSREGEGLDHSRREGVLERGRGKGIHLINGTGSTCLPFGGKRGGGIPDLHDG